jgi:hypothetical protein
MVTITVSLPNNEQETVKLIETLTKEKGYKLIKIDRSSRTILFEINKDFDESENNFNKPQLLLD